jgi:hypothetical protein
LHRPIQLVFLRANLGAISSRYLPISGLEQEKEKI